MKLLTWVLLAGLLGQGSPEERIDDTEYERFVAAHVKAVESVEKTWRKDPAAALRSIEAGLRAVETELLPRLPRLVEATIAVRATRGIDKGEVKERHPFFPYRLAGEIALAAGAPARAVELLQKSPSSAGLLAEARKAAAAKDKEDPPPPPAPPPPVPKPAVDVKPFLEKRDFTGAIEAVRAKRDALGADADRLIDEVRHEAARHQQATVDSLAGLLPRLDQPGFRKDHLEPCLQSCARIPADLESEELRWIRRLEKWIEKRDPAEFERLAIRAAKFGSDFTVLCDRAQDERLKEIDRLVGAVNLAERVDRPRLLDELGQAERAFGELSAAHERPELKDRLPALKAKLPIDEKALEDARKGPSGIAEIRRLADELDRLWTSERRARLSLPDQKELALQLGVYRSMALFLEGKTIPEAAQDVRLREVFRAAGDLPPDASPKIAAVRARIGK
jgi:hypothetical protein